jgi:hypothetical protein
MQAAPAAAYNPPPPQYSPAPASGASPWVAFLGAFAVVAAVAGGVWYFLERDSSAEPPPAIVETTSNATLATAKNLEVAGMRITETKKQQLFLRAVLVNHSTADMGDLNGVIVLKSTEGKEIARFAVKLPTLPAMESREVSGAVTTKLRAYELPDWQFLKGEVLAETGDAQPEGKGTRR